MSLTSSSQSYYVIHSMEQKLSLIKWRFTPKKKIKGVYWIRILKDYFGEKNLEDFKRF
jgi:hypothetical protein